MTDGSKRRRTSIQARNGAANVPEPSLVDLPLPDTEANRPMPPSHSMDSDTSERALSWIHDNYEWKLDSNVPRSGMFEHYRQHCISKDVKMVNSATLGKLIRMAFPEITTRRLGIRGQSRYQYCNIQLKPSSEINNGARHQGLVSPISTDTTPSITNFSSATHGFPSIGMPSPAHTTSSSGTDLFSVPPPSSPSTSALPRPRPVVISEKSLSHESEKDSPEFKALSAQFERHYNHHCRLLHTTIYTGAFDKIESIYREFYQSMPDSFRSLMTTSPKIAESIWHWDCMLYDSLVVNVVPKIDAPTPDQRRTDLLHYIKSLPAYLDKLLQDYPSKIRQHKVNVAELFASKLHRHLMLNRLAITSAHILGQRTHLEAMYKEWVDMDLDDILDETLWISDCRKKDMEQILRRDIPHLLTVGSTLAPWMAWEETLIDMFVPRFLQNQDTADVYVSKAKQFMLKWKVHTGSLIRQLSIKKVPNIDAFRSLLLFLDELVLYHVEERISLMNSNLSKLLV